MFTQMNTSTTVDEGLNSALMTIDNANRLLCHTNNDMSFQFRMSFSINSLICKEHLVVGLLQYIFTIKLCCGGQSGVLVTKSV